MQKPKCTVCGVEEWGHLCSGAVVSEIGRRGATPATMPVAMQRKSVASRATKPVATHFVASDATASVALPFVATASVACQECKRLRKALKEANAEIEALHGEVAMLKRAHAGGKEGPMSSTERSRLRRAKLKASRREG